MVYLTRRYRFAASHRLHNPALTREENARIYGKCNNPYGHGHNYVLEVTLAGPVDSGTGMVFDLAALDTVVEREILDRLDQSCLNLDVELFKNVVPTTENVCMEVYKVLREQLERIASRGQARLHKVRLEETSSNYFEYEG
ncbi:MAG: 6-carboxytetrahydropterin synthase [Terriglobia bacterium]